MATKRPALSEDSRREVIELGNDAVVRAFEKEVEIHAPDVAGACDRANATLKTARDKWKNAGEPTQGPVFQDYMAALFTAGIICGLAGKPRKGSKRTS